MNLLPKTREEFASKSYWDSFFKKRKNAFEWYGEYSHLCGMLHKHCKPVEKVLMVGCGNSKLSEDMYDVGYHHIVNIDISDLVIKQMIKKNNVNRSKMKYIKMDIKETSFDNEEYDVVIDKGTLDALFIDNKEETVNGIKKMFGEIHRTLKTNGRYICVTLAQGHILEQLLSHFGASWLVHVYRIEITNDKNDDGLGGKLPVFAFIFTKVINTLSLPRWSLSLSDGSDPENFSSVDELKTNIQNLQGYAIIQNKLVNSSLDEIVTVDLWSDVVKSQEPRYSLTVVDTAMSKLSSNNGKFAIFIVPQGHEYEYTYSTDDGRKSLAEIAGFTRLVIASLHRGHVYTNLEEIKTELSKKVMELAPPGLSKTAQVPFLTASSDIGNRDIQHEDSSAVYGPYLVEDVQSSDLYYYRQLLFRSDLNIIHAQARLMIDKSSKRKIKLKKRICDHRYLMLSSCKAMLAGLTLVKDLNFADPGVFNVLVLGLHGGCFVSFLLDLFPEVQVTCVERDPQMIEVANTYFQLPIENERLQMVSMDVTEYLRTNQQKATPLMFDVVIMDNRANRNIKKNVSSNNNDVTQQILAHVKSSLKSEGIYMRHEVSHKKNKSELEDLTTVFSTVFETELDDSSNVLYILFSHGVDMNELVSMSQQKIIELKKFIQDKRKGFYLKDEWEISSYIENLRNVSD